MTPGGDLRRRPSSPLAVMLALTLAGTARSAESDVGSRAAGDALKIAPARGIAAFIENHCVHCHDADERKGNLDLTALVAGGEARDPFGMWVRVHDRVRDGEMPPKKRNRPPPAELAEFLRALNSTLHAASELQQVQQGRALARRLNRDEYQNTLRDLLGVEQDFRPRLPEDGRAFGFDKVGSALSVSAEHLESYLEVARAALAEVIATGPAPGVFKKTIPQRMPPGGVIRRFSFRFGEQPDALVRFSDFNDRIVNFEGAEIAGTYRFRVRARAWGGEPVRARIKAGGRRPRDPVSLVTFTEFPPEGATFEVSAYLNPGETLRVAPVGIAGPAHTALVTDVPFLPGMEGQLYPGPGLALEWVEVEGPLFSSWPKPAHHRIFGDINVEQATGVDAERVLRDFLPLAFRRPITDDELRHYLSLYEKVAETHGFRAAIKVALQAALCSPHFLFLHAPPGPLDDFALATRLSYFLWSSTPDDALTTVARSAQLRQPEILRQQVERMLNDPKAAAFNESFTGQWLDLRRIAATTPDERLYPEWDELIEWSSVEETRRFFAEILQRNLGVTTFVESNFAMLNDRLAAHYGISGVKGLNFRRVALPPGSARGGVLAQASVLKVTANGTTTSPVTRGVWVLERILGQHVPPPPQSVPAIEPDIRGATTVRAQLAKHRTDAVCATCHAKIDPPGFALERFDVIGGWRDRYRASADHASDRTWIVQPLTFDALAFQRDSAQRRPLQAEVGLGPAVDASGEMTNGVSFDDYLEFRKRVLANPEQLTRALAEHLVAYATGAGQQYADRAAIERIVGRVRERDGGFRTLIHELVQSPLFLKQ